MPTHTDLIFETLVLCETIVYLLFSQRLMRPSEAIKLNVRIRKYIRKVIIDNDLEDEWRNVRRLAIVRGLYRNLPEYEDRLPPSYFTDLKLGLPEKREN